MNEITEFMNWIHDSNHIVFFGGAGVSTESGIPDFRSVDGLYNQQYDYSPETILSHTFFMRKTNEFFRFYKNKMICQNAKPNITHIKLAELESQGKVKAVITQNIDGLHQMAGSKNVIELHGSVHRNYCMKCGKYHGIESVIHSEGIPTCQCGGIIKPDVVLYEEALKDSNIDEAIKSISNADMLIVGGTSLSVYPAAGLIEYYTGNKLVLINKSTTSYDNHANLLLKMSLGDVFSKIN